MNIYIGNMAYATTEETLKNAFAAYGTVSNIHVITDRETGRSKGFGFVEMENDAKAQAAIEALNGTSLDNRKIVVNEARPRQGGRGGFGQRRF